MVARSLLVVAALLFSLRALDAQSSSRFNSPIPLWADSALTKAGFWGAYDFTSRLNPQVAYADLDDDGLWDVAAGIVDRQGRRRGIVVVHQIDRSVHVVGAGRPLGNGNDRFDDWGVALLAHHHDGLRVVDRHGSGWFVWNGRDYVWVAD